MFLLLAVDCSDELLVLDIRLYSLCLTRFAQWSTYPVCCRDLLSDTSDCYSQLSHWSLIVLLTSCLDVNLSRNTQHKSSLWTC